MKQNKISDSISVNDNLGVTPIGIVKLYDKSGKLILKTHNMVVKTGRLQLFNIFLKTMCGNAKSDTEDYTGSMLVNFSYTGNGIKTTPDLDINALKNGSEDGVSAVPIIEYNDADLSATFKVNLSGNNSFKRFNQIYLTYAKDNDSSNPILFSRVAIDPVYIGSNGSYSLEYTLHF